MNVGCITSIRLEDIHQETTPDSIYGEVLYRLKIKLVIEDEIFDFETEDERQEFIEIIDERLYNINTYKNM